MRQPLFALALAMAIAAPVKAQEPPTTDSADIVVTGTRLQEMAQEFVGTIAEAPQAEDQLARWNSRICPGAVGLPQADAQRLVDRISMRANAVGLRPGEPGCRPNVLVIFAPDSDALTRQVVDQRRDLLGYYGEEGVVTRDRAALEAFATTPRAVRWWHVAQTTSSDGQAVGNADSHPGLNQREAAAALRMQNGPPAGGGDGSTDPNPTLGQGSFRGMEGVRSQGSRMRRATRQDLNYVLIVVDARRVAGVSVHAWTDYVAMVALAQVDPDAQPRTFSTILNLFSAPQNAPTAMTDWDVAYLQGLYDATREAANSRQQRQQIADRIVTSVQAGSHN